MRIEQETFIFGRIGQYTSKPGIPVQIKNSVNLRVSFSLVSDCGLSEKLILSGADNFITVTLAINFDSDLQSIITLFNITGAMYCVLILSFVSKDAKNSCSTQT